jgi:hypothetical protein
MLELHILNLISLMILLAPGIFAGTIVTWHTRSTFAIFKTILASLAVSFLMGVATIISGKLLSPILSGVLGNWTELIDFAHVPTGEIAPAFFPFDYILHYYRYSIIAPIGVVAGAALSGMLLVVSHKLRQEFDSSLGVAATVSATLLGGLMSMVSILSLTWVGVEGFHFAIRIFGDDFLTKSWHLYAFVGIWWILVLVNSLFCGLTCAFFGMKVARLLT